MKEKALSSEAKEGISERLSHLQGLYFPRSLSHDASNPPLRKSILFDLLSRDAAVFLERYGTRLTPAELNEFDSLKDDYEINWHLKHLRSLISPTTEELHSRSVTVKNRRSAYMNKLIRDGHYFSEDAMREREPYLHHEYVGKFQDPTSRSLSRPGERWSETLLRRAEEAILVAKIRGEQQRLGILEKDWVGNEEIVEEEEEQEEEEEEEEEEEVEEDENAQEDAEKGKEGPQSAEVHVDPVSQTTAEPYEEAISEAEMQDQMEQFTHIMQQKFLAGEDAQHLDYSKIDDDETLDDHWFREATEDAEEKYFDED
ncbi:hypothetical protein AAC387_Pa01g3116 [Persea americana]